MELGRRRLVVVRHAKSAWPPGVPDRQRPLGPRGQGDAPRMGAFLHEQLGNPQLATVSPALRAWETWQLLAAQLGPVPEVRTDDRIYDEWGGRMIDVVRELPDAAATVVIVGHEPGVSRLVLQLADRANPLARDRISAKFPTCAAAVLTLGMPWAQAEPGAAALESFTTPKDLAGRS